MQNKQKIHEHLLQKGTEVLYNFHLKLYLIFFQVLRSLWQWSNSTNSSSNNHNKATNNNDKKNNNYHKAATEALLLQGQEL